MVTGRPRKPTTLKALQGTARPDRTNAREPEPPPGPVKPPSWLKGRARAAWRQLAPMLEDMRVLTTADPHALALLCDAYAEYIDCREVVRKQGAVYESRVVKASSRRVEAEGGDEDFDAADWSVIIRPRPEVKMASDAWRRVHRMLVEFGLTPSSRSKVSAGGAEDADPFEEFLRGTRAG